MAGKKQLERIAHYEELLDSLTEKVNKLRAAITDFDGSAAQEAELAAYYGGKQWKKDFADDEAGLLPQDLKRGVLSEDAVYDLLEEYRELRELLGSREDEDADA